MKINTLILNASLSLLASAALAQEIQLKIVDSVTSMPIPSVPAPKETTKICQKFGGGCVIFAISSTPPIRCVPGVLGLTKF